MVPVLEVLAWVGMMQTVVTTVGTIHISTGNAALALKVTVIGAPLLVLGMAAGLPWGIYGVAVGYACASFSVAVISCKVAFRVIALDFKSFFAALMGPSAATAIMIGALLLALPLGAAWSAPQRLFSGVAWGAVVYVAATLWLNRPQVVQVYAMMRTLWQRQ
jgi:O-antigen/teichoic acid export membrane protein